MDKICSQCGTKNSENSKFCENCGNELHNVNKTETKSKNNTIIAILIAIVVILFIATAALFIGSSICSYSIPRFWWNYNVSSAGI